MALNIGDNFSYLGAKPLDARRVFASKAALDAVNLSTVYEGMVAYAQLEDKYYRLKSGVWVEFQSGSGITDWAINTSYSVGDLVINNNNLYQCKTAHTSSSTFSDTNWEKIGEDYSIKVWSTNKVYKEGNIVLYGDTLYQCNADHTSSSFASDSTNWDIIYAYIPYWKFSLYYKVGATVINGSSLYRCKTAHTSGLTFDTTEKANWTEIGGGSGTSIKDWESAKSYSVGDLAIYNNFIYKCTTANSDTNFDIANWQKIGNIPSWQANTQYYASDLVIKDNKLYQCKTSNNDSTFDIDKWDLIAGSNGNSIDNWKTSTEYSVGNVVIYNNSLFYCTTKHTSGSFNTDIINWKLMYSDIKYWENGVYYASGVTVIYNNKIYKCITANMDSTFTRVHWQEISGLYDWQSGSSYYVGDIIINNNILYRCNTANNDNTFTVTKWDVLSGGGIFDWVTSTYYKVGDFVLHQNNIYKCIVAHTSGTFNTDISNWQIIDNIHDWSSNTDYFIGDFIYYDKNIYRVTANFTSTTTFSVTNLEMLGGTPLTTAEENAIINNFTPNATAFNNVSNLYTTEERAIGIWIDGKTLYQKTVQVVLPSSSGSQSYSYMPSIPWGDIDTLVDADGFVNRSDGWYVKYGVTFVSSSGSYLKFYIDWNKSTSQIYFFVDANNPGTAGQKATLTFKYTKI